MKIAIELYFFFLWLILSGYSEKVERESIEINETLKTNEADQILQELDNLEENVKGIVKSIIPFSLRFLLRTVEGNLSYSCFKTGIQFLKDFLQLKPWTLKLLDSLGKPSSGILKGMLWIQGDYDECLKIGKNLTRKNEIIHGKYCAIMIEFKSLGKDTVAAISNHNKNALLQLLKKVIKPLKISDIFSTNIFWKTGLRLDVCLPSACTEADLNSVINLVKVTRLPVTIRVDFCTTKERKMKYTPMQIVSIIFFSMFFIFVVLATSFDAMQRLHIIPNNKANFLNNVISISAFTSTKKLFSESLWERTAYIYGIKILVTTAIVFGHLTYLRIFMPTVIGNVHKIIEMLDYFPQEVSYNSPILVETFFFISGFLIFFVPKNEDRLWLPQVLKLLKRITKLASLGLCTLATLGILSLNVDGPHSNLFIEIVNDGVENFWHSFMYNILQHKQKMFNHFWFIITLVQLTVITWPFVLILNRWPKYGKLLLIVAILVGFTAYAVVLSIKKIFVIFGYSIHFDHLIRYAFDIYISPFYSHLSSFCFGLLIGSYVRNKQQLKFRKVVICFFWMVAAILLGLAIFGLHGYIKEEFPNENIFLVHNIFSPYAWMVGIAWVCVACVTGNGGLVRWFLSLKFFVVLGRLNVWIYLLHPILILYTFAQLRTTLYISEINLWILFAFIMCFAVVTSATIYVFLQTPLDFLIDKLFGQNCLKKPSSKKVYKL